MAVKSKSSQTARSSATANVTVTFRQVAPTAALRDYAERKLSRISRSLKRSVEAHLILEVDKYRQCGEVTVRAGRFVVSAQEETKDLYSVIDLLEAKVQRQIKRQVKKFDDRRMRALSAAEVLAPSGTITPSA